MSALPADRGPPNPAPPASAEAPATRSRRPNRRGRGRRNNSPRPDDSNNGTGPTPVSNSSAPRGRGRNRNRPSRQEISGTAGGEGHQVPPHLAQETQGDVSTSESTGSHSQPRRGRGGARGNRNSNRGSQAPGRGGRRQHFGARLTEGSAQSAAPSSEPVPPPPTSGDLTSRLIYSLSHKHDAVDCPICFNPIHPAQPIWSCAPPTTVTEDAPVTCWTIFHMKCIKEWARKSVEATREAYRARNVDLPVAVSLVRESGGNVSTLAPWHVTLDHVLLVCVGDYWDAKSTLARRSVTQDPVPLAKLWTLFDAIAKEKRLGREGGNVKKFVIGILIAANTNARRFVTHLQKLLLFVPFHPHSLRHVRVRKHPSPSSAPLVPTQSLLAPSHVAGFTLSVGMHALSKSKAKRRVDLSTTADIVDDDPEGWHACDLVCNKKLSCGNHNCTLPDHRGPCPRCLQSSFEDLVCPCNRTIIEAPVPCGTRMNCTYPCAAPPPQCGHPRTPHTCHAAEEGSSCPPCPHLTNRQCDCGKSLVRNVRCSQERASCGAPCGKPLDCGYHSCDRACHTGDCGSCTQICGKPRKTCGHPCPVPCHAPSACPSIDAVACPAVITVTCACGRLTQPAPCGASRVLKCQDACLTAKRNLRLAEALGISESKRSPSYNQVTWSPELIAFARAPPNQAFVKNMEKALADFVAGDKKAHVLPHMPETRRKIVMEVAEVYRITTQLVDEEPRRSVQLIRRIDSRIPNPLLSQVSAPAPSRLGSLGDLRKPATIVKPASPSGSSASAAPAWSSGTPPSHVVPSAASNPGPPTSGNLPQGSGTSPWARSSAASIARTPIPSTASRVAPASLERAQTGETREDVPANWEDD